jgi:TonB-linked SusC/RagA family outer membrane protein
MKTLRFIFSAFFLLLFSTSIFAQRKVSGTVRDNNNQAVPGVTVAVKNTNVATGTDANGAFTVEVPRENSILVFSSIGYRTIEMPVGTQSILDVKLDITASEGEAVVVVAYGGSQKKATLSGSVASVKGEEILKSPAINVSNSLAGRVPGLTVVGQGGEPGNDFSTILVRGVNTFKDATPLFVIDGIPLQGSDKLQRIDPSVIESITVLKDASAAIYGSQGANGVILITTKRGKAGKVSVSASFNQGFSQPTQLPDLLNSYEIAVLQNEALDADPGFVAYTPAWHSGRYSVYEMAGFLRNDDPWHYANTDWMGELLKDWTLQNYANVTVSGGSEKLRGSLSMASRFQDGFVKSGSGQYKQYDVRGNMDFNPSRYITFSLDLNGRVDDADFPIADAGRIFHQTTGAPPSRRAYWPDGTLGQSVSPTGQEGSPVAISTPLGGYNRSNNHVINGTAKLNIKIPWVEGLSFTTTGTIDRVFQDGKRWTIPVTYNEWDGVSTSQPVFNELVQGDPQRTLYESQRRERNYLFNFLANYERRFGVHGVKLLYGYEEYERDGKFQYVQRKGFAANNLDQMAFGSIVNQSVEFNNPGATRWRNYLGRLNYDFNSKILAEFVFRYQASSIFHEDNRWGFFPGASLAYRISEENFWKNNIKFINSFKVRASWGRTGNDLIRPFQYLALYATPGDHPNYVMQVGANGELQHISTLQQSVAASEDVTWEKGDQLDIGFDAELIRNKLSITFDWFRNKRTDILTPLQGGLPSSTGIIPPDQNIGEFLNRGFDFDIMYKSSAGQVKYSVGLNGLYAKNKYVFFDEVAGRPAYQQQTGHPIGAGRYYHVLGIYRSEKDLADHPYGLNGATPVLGDLIFEDVNKDGKIDDLDPIRSDKSGVPTFSGGLHANVEYRNFDLSILFQGAFGAVRYLRPTFSLGGNYLQSFYDKRWTPENPGAEFPRIHSGQSAYWSNPTGVYNDFFLKKTDYVRLKNVELGYTLPRILTGRLSIERVRIYVNALNLLTVAPDLKDYDTDPEQIVRDQFFGESYPLQKVINFGIHVNF